MIVVGRTPELATTPEQQIAQRALEGFTRSLGKEVKRGATVNLVYVAPDAHDQLDSTLRLLPAPPKSAYVDGSWPGSVPAAGGADPARRWPARSPLVTGAARGIGAAIAKTLARDGATVIGVDVPQNGHALRSVISKIGGNEVLLDVTAVDAPQRIAALAQEKHGGLDIVVHNAGITRDKRLANMRTDALGRRPRREPAGTRADHRAPAGVRRTARRRLVIGVACIAGIAGNNGQTNYATSKAGVIGLVQALRRAGRSGRSGSTRSRRVHRDRDDREGAVRDPRGRPPDQLAAAGRPADRRGRDDRLVRRSGLRRRHRQRGPRLRPEHAGRAEMPDTQVRRLSGPRGALRPDGEGDAAARRVRAGPPTG